MRPQAKQGEPPRVKKAGKLRGKVRQASRKKQRRSRGMGPHSYTVPAAGQMIGLSRSANYRAAHSGEIPTIQINGGMVVPKALWDGMLGIEAAQKAAAAAA
jgi:hypothetical protein